VFQLFYVFRPDNCSASYKKRTPSARCCRPILTKAGIWRQISAKPLNKISRKSGSAVPEADGHGEDNTSKYGKCCWKQTVLLL
jgi:hypothetical protein